MFEQLCNILTELINYLIIKLMEFYSFSFIKYFYLKYNLFKLYYTVLLPKNKNVFFIYK